MQIFHGGYKRKKNQKNYMNCLVLHDVPKDDSGLHLLFDLVYYAEYYQEFVIGTVKIYHRDCDEKSWNGKKISISNKIGAGEIKLNENEFCSLGQSLNYYRRLKSNLPDDYLQVLKALNDIAVFDDLKEQFLGREGVQKYLLRDSSAEKALYEANDVLETGKLNRKDLSFSYLVRVPYSSKPVRIDFDFSRQEYLPYRINVLIGKNGTGKTQILTHLANEISGLTEMSESHKKIFFGPRPLFDKVISISYSAFDRFEKRKKSPFYLDEYRRENYAYCGIMTETGAMTLKELQQQFSSSLEKIQKNGRVDLWREIAQELLGAEFVEAAEISQWHQRGIHRSSGQNILLCTITEVVAKIEEESLILFDEPELHLHPNAIASMMRTFYKLLESFNSYAIFATHSPLVVQETPSAYVHVLNRIDDTLMVSKPQLECFGENVTNITNEIFDVSSSESNYKTVLERLSRKMPYEEVLDLFDGKLSFHAMIYLKSCYESNKMSF